LDQDIIKTIPHKADLAWSRPLNPRSSSFDVESLDLEHRLMQCNQIHTCQLGACLSYQGQAALLKCKRRAPWLIEKENLVDEKGNWMLK